MRYPLSTLSLALTPIIMSLTSSAAPLGSWTSFRNGPSNSARNTLSLSAIESKFRDRRPTEFLTQGLIWATPVITANGDIIFGSADKWIYSLDSNNSLKWKYEIHDAPDAVVDSAAVLTPGNLVVVPGGDGYLHALDVNSGTKSWEFKSHAVSDASQEEGETVNSFEGNVQLGPNGILYAGSDNGTLYAVSQTGQELWSLTTGMMIWSTPAFEPSGAWMAFGSLDGYLYLVNPTTGAVFDKLSLGGDVKSSPTLGDDGNLYVGSSASYLYSVRVVKKGSGYRLKSRWRYKTDGEVYSSPVYYNQSVLFGSLGGHFYRVDHNGDLIWSYAVNSPVASSPALLSDGSVLFGARNGKLYALNGDSGERTWSYRTSTTQIMCNLDSSPAISADGKAYVGSYSGKLFGIPLEYCSQNRNDPMCEFGGKQDAPSVDDVPAPTSASLYFEDREGNLSHAPATATSTSDILKLQLVAYEDGNYILNAAIDSATYSLSIDPAPSTDYEVRIAADGSVMNVIPTGPNPFFKAGQTYKIHAKGRYFHRTNWFWDRFKWLGLNHFEANLEYTVPEAQTSASPSATAIQEWGLKGFYLTQPKALDTYTPAALEGQAYRLLSIPTAENSSIWIGVPALATQTGFAVLPEPSRGFIMRGQQNGTTVRGEGKFSLSAMGGSIPIEDGIFSATIGSDGNLEQGQYFIEASCMDIKGNGQSYDFPLNVAEQICNESLHLIGIGGFSSQLLAPPTSSIGSGSTANSASPFEISDIELHKKSIVIAYTANWSAGPHLLTTVEYRADGSIFNSDIRQLVDSDDHEGKLEIKWPKTKEAHSLRKFIVLFDDVPIAVPQF